MPLCHTFFFFKTERALNLLLNVFLIVLLLIWSAGLLDAFFFLTAKTKTNLVIHTSSIKTLSEDKTQMT